MKKLVVLALSLFAAVTVSNAQVCALKSNALYLGIGAVNLGAEFSVAPQWTVDVSGTAVIFSPWKNVGETGLYLNGWDAVAEARYYLCKAFNGHHFGAFLEAARFGQASAPYPFGSRTDMKNIQAGGLGVSYGYYFKLNTYWGIDCTVGMGAALGRYEGRADGWTVLPLPRAQVAFSYKF
ncbi:MAG: DUF3575 domain-containing protein [Tidjanibacter sp.]|nr:DUF3575 domain-containing protein [Tidjanibacter sp.]MBR3683019.1 DUF3575 domain-containing protein [Tidjanibacter sp.]